MAAHPAGLTLNGAMTIKNLRCEARLEARVPIVIVRGRKTLPLVTYDVSFRGLFLQTPEPPPMRSLVRMRVTLPEGDFEAHAMVVHVLPPGCGRDSGVGLQFWGLSGPARTAWDDFVRGIIDDRRAAAKQSSSAPPATSSDVESSGIRLGVRSRGGASSN